jgi:hypothetical protein
MERGIVNYLETKNSSLLRLAIWKNEHPSTSRLFKFQ